MEIDRIWQDEQRRRDGAMVNGRIISVLTASPVYLTCRVSQYKHFMAQIVRPELFEELQVRPLSVSGVLSCEDGIVFGRRASNVTQAPALWELAPSGGISEDAISGTHIDLQYQILTELSEEVGINRDDVVALRPFCLIEDDESHVLDIGIFLKTSCGAQEILERHRQIPAQEYSEIAIIPASGIDAFIRDLTTGLIPVSAALIAEFEASGSVLE